MDIAYYLFTPIASIIAGVIIFAITIIIHIYSIKVNHYNGLSPKHPDSNTIVVGAIGLGYFEGLSSIVCGTILLVRYQDKILSINDFVMSDTQRIFFYVEIIFMFLLASAAIIVTAVHFAKKKDYTVPIRLKLLDIKMSEWTDNIKAPAEIRESTKSVGEFVLEGQEEYGTHYYLPIDQYRFEIGETYDALIASKNDFSKIYLVHNYRTLCTTLFFMHLIYFTMVLVIFSIKILRAQF